MNAQDRWKQLCILDAVTASNLCKVDLKDQKAIEWLVQDFRVVIPHQVFKEARKYVLEVEDAESVFYRLLQERISYETIDREIQQVIKDFDRKKHIDNGELLAASLALTLSRSERHYVVLITDDFDSHAPLVEALVHQQIGNVYSSYLAFA